MKTAGSDKFSDVQGQFGQAAKRTSNWCWLLSALKDHGKGSSYEAIEEMLTTRIAEETDLSRIVQLLWDDEQGRKRESLSDDDRGRYLAAFQTLQQDTNAVILVAIEDDEVCGCLQLNILSGLSFKGMRRGLIEDVRVAQTHRRKGIGRLLVLEAVDHSKTKGCGMIELFVHEDRKAAHKFYEACGFEGRHRGYRQGVIND